VRSPALISAVTAIPGTHCELIATAFAIGRMSVFADTEEIIERCWRARAIKLRLEPRSGAL
jgi:hypothetical protein